MNPEKTICPCGKVTKGDIMRAVEAIFNDINEEKNGKNGKKMAKKREKTEASSECVVA